MKVNSYSVATIRRDGAPPPRVWRISTEGGILWLADEGGRSRLIRLPFPIGDSDNTSHADDRLQTPCEALALAAETEAAGRWVRDTPAPMHQPTAGDRP
jgi:hypothetical protein